MSPPKGQTCSICKRHGSFGFKGTYWCDLHVPGEHFPTLNLTLKAPSRLIEEEYLRQNTTSPAGVAPTGDVISPWS